MEGRQRGRFDTNLAITSRIKKIRFKTARKNAANNVTTLDKIRIHQKIRGLLKIYKTEQCQRLNQPEGWEMICN